MEERKYEMDRGMMKWQGLILSEHQQALDALRDQYQRDYQPPVQQEESEIAATLSRAFKDHIRIWLATNDRNMEGIYEEYEGYIDGVEEDQIFVSGQQVAVDHIRAAEYIEAKKFWQ